jgi:hypothetical protein
MHSSQPLMRATALVVAGTLTLPLFLAGCGGQSIPPPPPVDDTRGGQMAPQAGRPPVARNQGMSTGKKVMILAGAAALWYMYNRHKKSAAAKGQDIQYYRSKNGRIYYRDPQTHQAHWVTPPTQPVQVPYEEAQQYSDIQGYNNQNSGRGLDQLFPAG